MEARDLKAILDSLNDVIIFSDPGNMIQFVNFKASEMIKDGYVAIGRSVFCAYDEAHHNTIKEALTRVINGEDDIFLFHSGKWDIYMRAVRNRKELFQGYLLWHVAVEKAE